MEQLPDGWEEKKRNAAKKVVDKLDKARATSFYEARKQFILALPSCCDMTRGFHAVAHDGKNTKDNEWCRCPCSTIMCDWRTRNNVNTGIKECSRKKFGGRFLAGPLVKHLQKLGEQDPFHSDALQYLMELYSNYYNGLERDGCFVSHKALYDEGTDLWKFVVGYDIWQMKK